jgi:polyhydroxybutyrate depolymerase
VTARQGRTAVILLAGLALLALVAWRAGASAVHYASDPSHEPCPAVTPGNHMVSIATPKGPRPVILHASRAAYMPRPLVIALRGADPTAYSPMASRENFLVAYPSGSGVTGGQVLNRLEASLCVNRTKVYVTGGATAARLACELSPRLAAVAVTGDARALRACRPARPLPVLAINGAMTARDRASVEQWLAHWRHIDRCRGLAKRIVPGRGVAEIVWRHCAAGTRVEDVQVGRAAHAWPHAPRTVPAAAAWRVWQLFRTLPPRAPARS